MGKMWLGMGLALWPWTGSFTLAASCALHAGPSFGANISMLWRGGRTVRAAMWPPWRSAPHAPNPSWTGSCGPWGKPTTLAALPVWCATVASTASLSQWMPPARSTALRTSTGSLPHGAQCVVGPSCLSQGRRRRYESLLWIAVFTLAVTSARSVGCSSPPRASVRAATRWMGTSCARRAVPGASRSSQPPSRPTAEPSQNHLLRFPFPSTTLPDIYLDNCVTKYCLFFLQS